MIEVDEVPDHLKTAVASFVAAIDSFVIERISTIGRPSSQSKA